MQGQHLNARKGGNGDFHRSNLGTHNADAEAQWRMINRNGLVSKDHNEASTSFCCAACRRVC